MFASGFTASWRSTGPFFVTIFELVQLTSNWLLIPQWERLWWKLVNLILSWLISLKLNAAKINGKGSLLGCGLIPSMLMLLWPGQCHGIYQLLIICAMYASSECYFGVNLNPLCKPSDVSYTLIPTMCYLEFLPIHRNNGVTDSISVPKLLNEKEQQELVDVKIQTLSI